jgi:demethylmenaquinone methyltransferase/2-methoxy-6-polyprenyl-1,4-benzoquinol methylase
MGDTATTGRSGAATDTASDRRGRRVYDRWSEHGLLYGSLMRLAAPLRAKAFDALAAAPGERVLDLACGPGTNFERLRAAVGPDGSVVGLDYSEGMVRRARERADDGGWTNVHVVRADATAPFGFDESFDAALTTMALHTMHDVDAVVENVHDALRPGGRFVVLDGRELQAWPATLLNPLFERAMTLTVNHRPDQDPLGALRATFETVEVRETFDLGSGYLAVARKRDGVA